MLNKTGFVIVDAKGDYLRLHKGNTSNVNKASIYSKAYTDRLLAKRSDLIALAALEERSVRIIT